MDQHRSAFDETPWQRMQSYSRLRLFATETPVAFDYAALVALVIAIDAMSSLSVWIEYPLTGVLWTACVAATSYYRARAELEAERLAEFQSRSLPAMQPADRI